MNMEMLAALLLLALLVAPLMAAPPMVFVHGIKGASLEDDQGRKRYLTGLQGLGLASARLALPLEWGPNGQARDALRPRGVLDKVVVIPGLVQSQVYGPWLKAAARSGTPFHPFAYDWRRDNWESLNKLEKFIEATSAAHGGEPVRVVAHSMGGLLTMAALHRKPELIHSAVFVGVPFPGGIGFLQDLHQGLRTGLNGRILSPEVLATFPSVYSLFPLQTDALGEVVDLFSVEDWRRARLGPYRSEPPAGFEAFFREALKSARAFRELVESPLDTDVKIYVVRGEAHPTLARIQRSPDGSWDFESLPREPGDGRVRATSQVPKNAEVAGVFTTAYEHSLMLNDPAVQAWIWDLP